MFFQNATDRAVARRLDDVELDDLLLEQP